MRENKRESRELVDVLECRFLNADAAGVVLDRIPQHELVRLYRWFVDEEGGMSGALLIDTAPILDTLIEVQARQPAFIVQHFPEVESGEEPGLGESPGGGADAEDAQAEPDGEGVHIEDFAEGLDLDISATPERSPGPPPGLHRRPEGNISGDSPQIVAYGFFGCGLMWGAGYLENVVDCDGMPFPLEGGISDFLTHVSNKGFNHLAIEREEDKATRVMSPVWLTQSLTRLCPSLDIVLRSAYKLSRRCKEAEWEGKEDGSHLRFIFFLGLLAAGLSIPEGSSPKGFAR